MSLEEKKICFHNRSCWHPLRFRKDSLKLLLTPSDLMSENAALLAPNVSCTFETCISLYIPALQKKPEDINLRAADMWSFAILLTELETREVPFADLSPMEIGMKVSISFACSMMVLRLVKLKLSKLQMTKILTGVLSQFSCASKILS